MTTDKKTVEKYVAPELTQIDIAPEGILLQASDVTGGGSEGIEEGDEY